MLVWAVSMMFKCHPFLRPVDLASRLLAALVLRTSHPKSVSETIDPILIYSLPIHVSVILGTHRIPNIL